MYQNKIKEFLILTAGGYSAKVVSYVDHTTCKCQCQIQAEHCTAHEVYDPNHCSCICNVNSTSINCPSSMEVCKLYMTFRNHSSIYLFFFEYLPWIAVINEYFAFCETLISPLNASMNYILNVILSSMYYKTILLLLKTILLKTNNFCFFEMKVLDF